MHLFAQILEMSFSLEILSGKVSIHLIFLEFGILLLLRPIMLLFGTGCPAVGDLMVTSVDRQAGLFPETKQWKKQKQNKLVKTEACCVQNLIGFFPARDRAPNPTQLY